MKYTFSLARVAQSFVLFFIFSWLVMYLFTFLGFSKNLLFVFILTMILSSFISLKNKLFSGLILFFLFLRLFLDHSIYSWNFVISFLFFLFLFVILTGFVNVFLPLLGAKIFSGSTKVDKLFEGAILAETISRVKKLSKVSISNFKSSGAEILFKGGYYYIKISKGYPGIKEFINYGSSGLTLQDIKKIQKIGFKSIRVANTIPFAPFIFAGVLVILIFNNNLLSLLKSLL